MKRYKAPLIAGLILGGISLIFFLLLGVGPHPMSMALMESRPYIYIVRIFTVDVVQPFLLLHLPYAVGADLAIWTIGLILWLIGYGSWPGQALDIVFSAHPALWWINFIFFTLLGGIVLVGIPYLIFQSIKERNKQQAAD